MVAPRVGAWIETIISLCFIRAMWSHPVWVRGLKPCLPKQPYHSCYLSHPVWVRGLKHGIMQFVLHSGKSHPVWVRGLKPYMARRAKLKQTVAPRVGAWIETSEGYLLEPLI